MQDDDDDSGTVVQGSWKRTIGYISEFDIDARWILYHPNDPRPQGSLRIVSHPDLPPGHLKSFVSIVTKRSPKTNAELNQTLEKYGLMNDTDLFFHNGLFYRNKSVDYIFNGVVYNTPPPGFDPNKNYGSIKVTFNNPISEKERVNMLLSVFSELDAYTISENIETWDTETMDKMRTLEQLYNVKIFQ